MSLYQRVLHDIQNAQNASDRSKRPRVPMRSQNLRSELQTRGIHGRNDAKMPPRRKPSSKPKQQKTPARAHLSKRRLAGQRLPRRAPVAKAPKWSHSSKRTLQHEDFAAHEMRFSQKINPQKRQFGNGQFRQCQVIGVANRRTPLRGHSGHSQRPACTMPQAQIKTTKSNLLAPQNPSKAIKSVKNRFFKKMVVQPKHKKKGHSNRQSKRDPNDLRSLHPIVKNLYSTRQPEALVCVPEQRTEDYRCSIEHCSRTRSSAQDRQQPLAQKDLRKVKCTRPSAAANGNENILIGKKPRREQRRVEQATDSEVERELASNGLRGLGSDQTDEEFRDKRYLAKVYSVYSNTRRSAHAFAGQNASDQHDKENRRKHDSRTNRRMPSGKPKKQPQTNFQNFMRKCQKAQINLQASTQRACA